MQRGFSLVELLVALVIFLMIVLAVYGASEQMQGFYTRSERRSSIQDNARLVLENMERDLRLAGYGVPAGRDLSPSGAVAGASPWLPAIFYADGTALRYRAESDNANTQLTQNTPEATASRIHVTNTALGTFPFGIVLVRSGKQWQHMTANSASSDGNGPYFSLSSSVSSNGSFTARATEVFTVEHVFYRFVSNASYPYGTIQKATAVGNTPTITVPADSAFSVMASNIASCQFEYFARNGTALTSFPLSATDRASVARIVVTITAREREVATGTVQDATLSSEILVRNSAL
jgi:prepilin-type N-terminal cleavage/methylation domain-containing protein